MDSNNNTTLTLIIINLLLNFLQVLDHIFSRLKSSKCWGASLQFNDNKDDVVKKPSLTNDNNDKLTQLIDMLNNNKSNNDNKNNDDNKLKI